ncbi:MAG: hypothetical protein HZA47_04830 [Planctomycetes bacterium]|uniref:hypothetical protein n=1 Tax=Candidatus Wunengus sp. YC65 TaxID=3367701 RepID=UPI001D344B6F|nr:hypothetical protein [Planctomycetota bacterium]MBI5795624.1 hypothetical protein [Planctomycetota bacterium]
MAKYVFFKLRNSIDVLAIIGWLCFVVGVCVPEPLGLKLTLLSAARVLPSTLRNLAFANVAV